MYVVCVCVCVCVSMLLILVCYSLKNPEQNVTGSKKY